jgi:hypothetical protein
LSFSTPPASAKSLKILTARSAPFLVLSTSTDTVLTWRKTLSDKTCAACDCPLDSAAISVNVGGKPVEVCCHECALALNEAAAALPEA